MLLTMLAVFLLQGPAPEYGNRFGTSACFIADRDGDERADLAIGNPHPKGGSVLIYSTKTFELVEVVRAGDGSAHFGEAVAMVGDQDGDGEPDLAVADARFEGFWKLARVVFVSSANHVPIRAIDVGKVPSNLRFGGATILGLDDLDDDASPDLVVAHSDTLRVVSSRSGKELWKTSCVYNDGGASFAVVSDRDQDGARDLALVLGDDGGVRILSGRSGAKLLELLGYGLARSRSVCEAGDVDRDGVLDLAIGFPEIPVQIRLPSDRFGGAVSVYSGTKGKRLWSVEREKKGNKEWGGSVCALSDLDADGLPDLLVTFQSMFGGARGISSRGDGRTLFRTVWVDSVFRLGAPGWVACDGCDLDADGNLDFVLGDYRPGAGGPGRLYVCSGKNGELLGAIPPIPRENATPR